MDHAEALEVRVNTDTDQYYSITWHNVDGYWGAFRSMPGVNQSVRLPALDTKSMLEIFKFMRDIIAGTIDLDLITPDL